MKPTFVPAMRFLLRHEGGWSNHPKDKGGMTNLGVTKRAWEDHIGHAVSETEMRDLTADIVTPFYKKRYWDAVHADELSSGVDYCVFDAAVNSGPSKAVRLLQDALGVRIDGQLGPKTLLAARDSPAHSLVANYTTARLDYLHSLPQWSTFGKGWQRRVEEVEQEAIKFATNAEAMS